ncbi:SIS domain-containing protein [Candidatus Microgenomates bacterium]|nr:SIS domain-containing protein [Candidatus Microgenomates bacterium]
MLFKDFLKELEKVFTKIDKKAFDGFVSEIKKAKRVYVVGAGRSGLVAKNLAMRLVRLGKEVFVIGETVTPVVKSGDLLIAISGSGETGSVLSAVKICRVKGTKILGVTGVVDSPLAKLSHLLIIIPAQIPQRLGSHYQLRELVGVPERSPTKSLFEVCALIFFEVGVSKLSGNQ